MTTSEFSDAFDTLINAYNQQAVFGDATSKMDISLDEYEKSIFLTNAQDQIVKSYFDRTLNPQGQGVDDSSRRQVDFSDLITITTPSAQNSAPKIGDGGDSDMVFEFPQDALFVLNERIYVGTPSSANDSLTEEQTEEETELASIAKTFVVVPISHEEYDRYMSKPYSQPLKKQAWRLISDNSTNNANNYAEIILRNDAISAGQSASYKIRYVKRPSPIVLVNLPEGMDIDGYSTVQQCKLNKSLHMDILNRAVELAIASRSAGRVVPQQK